MKELPAGHPPADRRHDHCPLMLNKKLFPFATLLVICLGAIACDESAAMQLDGGAVSPDANAGQSDTINSSAKETGASHTSITQAFLDTMRTPVGFSMGF